MPLNSFGPLLQVTTANTWNATAWSSWLPPDVNGTAGMRVPRVPVPPTQGGAVALDLPQQPEARPPAT